MHTIKLKVHDSIYGHIMFLLKSLNTQELEIIEDKVIKDKQEMKTSLDFSQYNIKSFQDIKDPVKWQQTLRDEWDR